MTFTFHPEAEEEFLSAVEYYEGCDPGLGLDFSIETYTTIRRIIEFPRAWSILDGEVRRCLLHRFPFGVIYSVDPVQIYILAVMHLHREPEYWKSRR